MKNLQSSPDKAHNIVDETDLRPTDAHLERMLAVAHKAGMEFGSTSPYPNFSIHAARALIKHEKLHRESRK